MPVVWTLFGWTVEWYIRPTRQLRPTVTLVDRPYRAYGSYLMFIFLLLLLKTVRT
jgi:hypothetical protein